MKTPPKKSVPIERTMSHLRMTRRLSHIVIDVGDAIYASAFPTPSHPIIHQRRLALFDGRDRIPLDEREAIDRKIHETPLARVRAKTIEAAVAALAVALDPHATIIDSKE